MNKGVGKVILVGAGPGDPGLLTLKGRQALEHADAVVYDRLAGEEALSFVPPACKRIDVGKKSCCHPVPQEEINRILIAEAGKGGLVVRLKGGDPFLFGRGGEELEDLKAAGIPFEVIPGVPSAIAAPAYGGIPVTHRDCSSSLHIITGHSRKGGVPELDYEVLSKLDGTLVFLMAVQTLPEICRGLMEGGMPPGTPAAMVENGSTPRQRRILSTLSRMREDAGRNRLESPAVLVVGEVCRYGERLEWFVPGLLSGVRVITTRASSQDKLGGLLRMQGAEILSAPCVESRPLAPNPPLEEALSALGDWSWIVFTSGMGVETFMDALLHSGRDSRALGGLRIAAVGPGTAARLRQYGLCPDLVPMPYNGQQLGATLLEKLTLGDRLLLALAAEPAGELPSMLERAGADFTLLPLYETSLITPPLNLTQILGEKEDTYVSFTSASAVDGFEAALQGGLKPSEIKALCIGPATARRAEKAGYRVFQAADATFEAMGELLIGLYEKK